MGTPSATQDPLIDTESDDDVSSSVVATRKMVLVDNTIINSQMQMDDMVPYNKISNLTRVTLLHLPKDIYQLVNKLNHYKGCNSVQNSSIRGYQECPSNFRERYLSCY
jgi:hypothetical protein